MGWMVDKDGYTMPVGRLDLGRKPNVNIYSETTINNYGYRTIFPQNMYGYNQYGGYPYGMYPENYDTGLSKAEKWMLGFSGTAAGLGLVFSIYNAVTGNNTEKCSTPTVADTPATQTPIAQTPVAQTPVPPPSNTPDNTQTERQQQAAETKRKESEEYQALQKEGITKNYDNTYTATVTGADGKSRKINGATLAEVRQKKTEFQAAQLSLEGIIMNSDGTFTVSLKNRDGSDYVYPSTFNSVEAAREFKEDIQKTVSDDNFIA